MTRKEILNINSRTGKRFYEGDLRVWFVVNPPNYRCFIYVTDLEEAMRVIEYETKRQMQDERIKMNVFGLECLEPDDDFGFCWCEWYHEENGKSICEYMDWIADEIEEQKIRRDIRTVAGAWKGHEELRKELEEDE